MISRRGLIAGASSALLLGRVDVQANDEFTAARARLAAAIERDLQATASIAGRRELDSRVLEALGKVPAIVSCRRNGRISRIRIGRCRSATGRRFRSPSSSR